MKEYRIYIIGLLLLALGAVLGWIVKPEKAPVQEDAQNHSAEGHTSDGNEVWTCSMHPQIRRDEFDTCPICGMDLTPADNTSLSDDPTLLQMSPAAVKLAQIETYVVKTSGPMIEGEDPGWILADGTVELDERTMTSQTAHFGGRLESMAVNFEGQYVTRGQKVATLYSTDLLAASQELISARRINARVEGVEDAAKQKLKNWKLSDEQIESILENNQPIKTLEIFADHAGYVLKKKAALGEYLQQGEILYTLGSINSLWLLFDVFESDAGKINIGSQLEFTAASLPGRTFQTRVTYINPILENESRTIQIRAEIKNPEQQLKPGMLLQAKIYPGKASSSKSVSNDIYVPASSILWTGQKSVVYVQDTSIEIPTYEFREVSIAESGTDYVRIAEGISIGDRVVVHGAFALDAAAQLTNRLSMMNRNVTIRPEEAIDVIPSFHDQNNEDFKAQINALVTAYIDVKDALVRSDAKTGIALSAKLSEAVAQVDTSLIQGKAREFWLEQQSAIVSHAAQIGKEADIEKQRDQFDFLSQAVIKVVKAYDPGGQDYFVQYCPMAIENKGANWISLEEKIRNPYFGDKMMSCGEVKLKL